MTIENILASLWRFFLCPPLEWINIDLVHNIALLPLTRWNKFQLTWIDKFLVSLWLTIILEFLVELARWGIATAIVAKAMIVEISLRAAIVLQHHVLNLLIENLNANSSSLLRYLIRIIKVLFWNRAFRLVVKLWRRFRTHLLLRNKIIFYYACDLLVIEILTTASLI